MPKKKKFIDKKKAVTFHLVHRSQKDPLQADDEAPKRVLLPTEKEKLNARKEEQLKYGINFEDEYDYMQHLKESREIHNVEMDGIDHWIAESNENESTLNIKLPSKLFGSNMETDVGMLNKAAPVSGPRLDLDPDLVAAMDDDFNFDDPDNQLEDDFISKANCEEGAEEDEGEYDECDMSSDFGEGDDFFDEKSFGGETFRTSKSRFTEYSVSSSVMRRNEGLSNLDDRFEELFDQYDDDEIGALDQEEIQGNLGEDNLVLKAALEEYGEAMEAKERTLKDEVRIPKTLNYQDSDEEFIAVEVEEEDKGEKWDCETILTTYSTIYNNPKVIDDKPKKIQLTKRLAVPNDALPSQNRATNRQKDKDIYKPNFDKACTVRNKEESAEERKARKKAIKDERRERRKEKKDTKLTFKSEKLKQQSEIVNLQKNISAVKIV
ncbi:DgyrCDS11662 [Dimorphilus gyrociliatus]|uniref:Protein LTV1 homolog n=1 Tax=Dimorphilus gyrociliatus TaxID=2664684 RepID=A0A7I8W475_9ANNE|nr:DgyrCDS11662 [Dimorphilus gyrociliatus]